MAKGKDSKPHIGIFGRRNNGKSSLINALAGHEAAIVSEVAGTTTDPVKKSIEIFGIGPAILVDTAGIDDTGELGRKRIAKSRAALRTIDMAVLVIANNTFGEYEEKLIDEFEDFEVPFIIIHNKSDLQPLDAGLKTKLEKSYNTAVIDFCAAGPANLPEVTGILRTRMPETAYTSRSLLGDLITKGDVVLLVTPIDSEAPEGRMILPQVQAIRDVLDNDAIVVVLKENALAACLEKMQPRPALVVTDSQVFKLVDEVVPPEIPITGFSIMLARHKGDFQHYLEGTRQLANLRDGDRVLMLESCTHQVSCDDIGRVKIPAWLRKSTGKKLDFDVVPGLSDLPRDISEYAIVIQCGGCVITRKQIINRLKPAVDHNIPVTNYGMTIAWLHGIFERAVAPFMKVDR